MAHAALTTGDRVKWTGDSCFVDRVLLVNGDLGTVTDVPVDDEGDVAVVQFEDGTAAVSTEHLEWVPADTVTDF